MCIFLCLCGFCLICYVLFVCWLLMCCLFFLFYCFDMVCVVLCVMSCVWFVGVGFGDVDLLMFRVVCVIGVVDVLFVDDFVNFDVLCYVCVDVLIEYVGKCGGYVLML